MSYIFHMEPSNSYVPKNIFLTNGVGIHRDERTSFERALHDADIEKYIRVYVSSIVPPGAQIIPRRRGLTYLRPGQIVYCVMAHNQTNEPHRLVAASIGLAVPHDRKDHGYLSEHHSFGETDERAGDYAEDLAASMRATSLGIEFDPNTAWQERENVYKASKRIIRTRNVTQSAEGDKNGRWTTVVAAAVFVMDT